MKWLCKLLIPKHEQSIVAMVDNATRIYEWAGDYNFIDDRGNGVRLYHWSIQFLVDKQPVTEWGKHNVSNALRGYMIAVYKASERIANKKYRVLKAIEDKEAFSKAVSEFDKMIKKE